MAGTTGVQGELPRVLIVEEDPDIAIAMVGECIEAGLEPKLCLGPDRTSGCPATSGEPCARTEGIEATLISITTGKLRQVAPACVGGKVVVAGERPLVGAATTAILHPDHQISYPYDPTEAAAMLASLVDKN